MRIPKMEIMTHPSQDARRNTDVTMDMMVVLGYCSLSAKRNWLQEVTYANGGLKVWCEKDTSKNTSIPSEGDEAETAGSDGSPVEGIALQHHSDDSGERENKGKGERTQN